jgi:hypothetical protein
MDMVRKMFSSRDHQGVGYPRGDDTAELIARLGTLRSGLGIFHDADGEAIDAAIKTLTAQAEEIEQSLRIIGYRDAAIAQLRARAEAAEARADTERTLRLTLTTERNQAQARVRWLEGQLREGQSELVRVFASTDTELATKEAATIERCAKVASTWSGDFDYPYGQERIATAIRALAKEPTAAPPVPVVAGNR